MQESMIQVELESGDGTIKQVIWLPNDGRVKVGKFITLVGDPDKFRWRIARTFITLDKEDINKNWRVGGIV